MPNPQDYIPEDVLKEAMGEAEKPEPPKGKPPENNPPEIKETKQRRLFKKRRAGVVLSREQVKEIKAGRKALRRDMRSRGIKSKREFELMAGSLGLYFDKRRGFLLWFWRHWLGALLGLIAALLAILFIFSMVTQLRGHFTINLADDMFREGFVLSETADFRVKTTELFANPAENVPCISIKSIPANVNEIDGEHNEEYFAYTYYIRNEGQSTVDYTWELELNSESKELSSAAWVMVFEDGKMRFYAEGNTVSGEKEALPPLSENNRGYLDLPILALAPDSDQFQIVRTSNGIPYYRVIPDKFESSNVITTGKQTSVAPGDVHKYTVVLWLEGDDKDTDNTKIGGHLGTQMNFRLARSEDQVDSDWRSWWGRLWNSMKFWE